MAANHEQNVDRLSNLPDLALGMIVSFLSFKEAGRTCILSKRWINIWRFANNIDRFDEFILYRPLPASSSSEEETNAIRRRVFIDFVKNYFLANRNPPEEIDTFHFSFSNPDEFQPDVDRLIRYIISKNVKDLDLEFSGKAWKKDCAEAHTQLFELPETLYHHELLESLKLSACNLRVLFFTNLRGLRKLSLGWIELTSSEVQSLVTNCELLESLSLRKCRKLDSIEITTSEGSRLSSFIIDDCSSLCELLLNIPTLRYFKYFGSVISPFFLESLSYIEEADLDFSVETEYIEFGDHLVTIFRHFDVVRVLTVCSYITQVIASTDDILHLTEVHHLILKTGFLVSELLGIEYMLRSCPTLASLTFRLESAVCLTGYDPPFEFVENFFWKTNGILIPCLHSGTLRQVRFEGFKGSKNEIEMLHYLVEQGSSLQRVTIVLSEGVQINDSKGLQEFIRNWASKVRKDSRNKLLIEVC